ncbi:MAG: chemotaxis response regulator protein-glutamate methylesterase [Maricaulaceae bacterium]
MLVDDSAVVRGLVSRWIDTEPDLALAGSCVDGQQALDRVAAINPDVIVLDIEMPRLDGLTALPELRKRAPKAKIVMASTLTRRGADVTLRALSAGAADYLAKPDGARLASARDFREDLLAKVRALGGNTDPRGIRPTGFTASRQAAKLGAPAPAIIPTTGPVKLRPARRVKPKAIVIGSSTGGPQALRVIAAALGPASGVPVLVVQHMPKTFTSVLAEHLDRAGPLSCVEAEDGMPIKPGRIHVARGDKHMLVCNRGGGLKLKLSDDPPENYCRPAVDPLFRSACEAYGGDLLALVLTGMGADGAAGSVTIADAGGLVLAQDEASSVVWGMPGAVARIGSASALVPLDKFGEKIQRIMRGNGL